MNSFTAACNTLLQVFHAAQTNWGSLHPSVVHIPIGLLFAAPLFILLGLLFQKSAKSFYTSALVLLIVGTLGILLSVSTGEKASEMIEGNPVVYDTFEAHEHLAMDMRRNFSILTIALAAYLIFLPALTKKFSPKILQTAMILFLVASCYSLILLLNTAHLGGKLVHHYKVTSDLFDQEPPSK